MEGILQLPWRYIHIQFGLTEVARPFLLRPGNEASLHQDNQTQLSTAGELVNKHSLAASTFGSQKQPVLTQYHSLIVYTSRLKCLTSIQKVKMEVDKITVSINLTSFHASQNWISSSCFFTSLQPETRADTYTGYQTASLISRPYFNSWEWGWMTADSTYSTLH